MPTRRGFSLVELITVLAVSGVMASIAIPRLASSWAHRRADAAARRIAADLALASTTARAKSQTVRLQFDTASGLVSFENVPALDGAGTYETRLADEPYRVRIDQLDLDGDAVLVFDGYGDADSDALIVVSAGIARRTVRWNAEGATVTIP